MKLVLVALCLIAGWAVPASAGLPAWLREGALPRLGAGVELGTAVPMDPFDFSAGWKDSRGYGAFATFALTPTVGVLLRAERDRFELSGDGFRRYWVGLESVTGEDVTLEALSLGLRVHHGHGALRGHATIYSGLARRIGRRVSVTWSDPAYTIPWGEPDATVKLLGFGVGATWTIPRLPDPTIEARAMWFGDGPEMVIPLRFGVALP